MVDSSRLPPSQVTKPTTPASVLGEQSARAVRLPDALTVLSRAVRIEGDVVRQNTDGTVRVNTPQGDIDIQVRGKQPQPGQRLEVDIPAGRPPRQITIRPAAAQVPQDIEAQPRPAAPATPQQSAPQTPIATRPTAPPQTQPPAQQTPAPPRPGAAPQPLPEQAAPRPAPQAAPLPSQTPVRFMPTTPAQAQQMVQAASQAMTTLPTTASRAAFTANLIAQGAQDANAQALQNIMQTRPADMAALAQQVRSAPSLPLSQPGAGTGATAALLQHILSQTPQNAGLQTPATIGSTTQPTPGAAGAPGAIIPATGTPAPLATLLAFTPGSDGAMATSSFGRLNTIMQMDARILSIQPPGAGLSPPGNAQSLPVPGAATITPPTATPQAAAGTVTGIVTGFTPQNLPLVTVQWPGGGLPQTFVLQFNAANLQPGSVLTLQPQNMQVGAQGATAAGGAPISPQMAQLLSLFGPGPWPVMDEAYQTLLQISPQLAQAFARSLPSPGNPAQLGATALLFIAAVRSGDIGSWLGDKKIDALSRAGKNNLLSRLTQDLSTLPGRAAESPALPGEWRPVPLPMFYDGQIQKIALYVKQDNENAENKDKKDGGQTRFIFDLDLDRMGGVQLDGLVREKRFDLVVRTQIPLSEPMRQAMKQSYSHALEDTELHGDISFQGDIKNWVNVLQKEAAFGASA